MTQMLTKRQLFANFGKIFTKEEGFEQKLQHAKDDYSVCLADPATRRHFQVLVEVVSAAGPLLRSRGSRTTSPCPKALPKMRAIRRN